NPRTCNAPSRARRRKPAEVGAGSREPGAGARGAREAGVGSREPGAGVEPELASFPGSRLPAPGPSFPCPFSIIHFVVLTIGSLAFSFFKLRHSPFHRPSFPAARVRQIFALSGSRIVTSRKNGR